MTDKTRFAVLTPSMFDDDEVIALIEHTPAYNRPPKFNEQLKKMHEATVVPESKPDIRDSFSQPLNPYQAGTTGRNSAGNNPSKNGGNSGGGGNVITF